AATRRRSAPIGLATACALPVAVTYVKATAAPLRASRRAIAAPIPRLPPVTSATLPASSSMSGSSRLVGQDHHAGGEGLGGDQRQWRLVAVAELRQPGPGQDRVDREPGGWRGGAHRSARSPAASAPAGRGRTGPGPCRLAP